MDNTNKFIKVCRRISDIEYAFECNDQVEWERESMREELVELEEEYYMLVNSNQIANDCENYKLDE
jgi:hypothetical protein